MMNEMLVVFYTNELKIREKFHVKILKFIYHEQYSIFEFLVKINSKILFYLFIQNFSSLEIIYKRERLTSCYCTPGYLLNLRNCGTTLIRNESNVCLKVCFIFNIFYSNSYIFGCVEYDRQYLCSRTSITALHYTIFTTYFYNIGLPLLQNMNFLNLLLFFRPPFFLGKL